MAFINGMLLLDAPGSALNNAGQSAGTRADNIVEVKVINAPEGQYPYVSAQAFRYWLRTTLTKHYGDTWIASPVFREQKIAYPDGNPIEYWDDDLFGYMRAQSKRTSAVEAREADTSRAIETVTHGTITRVSPLRVSTLVSLAPASIVDDFGVMARHEGNPVPHEHQFYKTVLRGLFSLDLKAAGTFSYENRTGFLNLDKERIELAQQRGLEHDQAAKTYRLPLEERINRVATLLQAFGHLEGGAKLTLHYTNVAPALAVFAVTRGGNNIFMYVAGTDHMRRPIFHLEAFKEALTVFQDDILSDVYVGWARGFLDREREKLEKALAEDPVLKEQWAQRIKIGHPRKLFAELAGILTEQGAAWF